MKACSTAQAHQVDLNVFPVQPHRQMIARSDKCLCGCSCKRVSLWRETDFTIDGSASPYAVINYGAGACGGPRVEVDWKNGVTVDVHGEEVQVSLSLDFKILAIAYPETFGALITCCPGGAARGIATRSKLMTPASGAAAIVQIPPFAYAVYLTATDDAFFAAGTTIQQLGSDDLGSVAADLAGNSAVWQDPGGWNLNGAARGLRIDTASSFVVLAVFLIGV